MTVSDVKFCLNSMWECIKGYFHLQEKIRTSCVSSLLLDSCGSDPVLCKKHSCPWLFMASAVKKEKEHFPVLAENFLREQVKKSSSEYQSQSSGIKEASSRRRLIQTGFAVLQFRDRSLDIFSPCMPSCPICLISVWL